MPTSIEQVQGFLDEYDLNYRVDPQHDAVLIGFGINPGTTTFRDGDGDPAIQFVIRVLERGEFLAIFTPEAWNVEDCLHKAAVFEALASIQTQYKMLRFDYDPTDGEIRPNIELPLEDAELTSRQFHRLLHGMLHGVQRFDGVIRHAMATGEVSFDSVSEDDPPGDPPSEVARLQRLAEEAGGLEALERLACGDADDAPEVAGLVGPPQSSEAAAETGASVPPHRPTIRRIWDALFGRDGQSGGEQRKAG